MSFHLLWLYGVETHLRPRGAEHTSVPQGMVMARLNCASDEAGDKQLMYTGPGNFQTALRSKAENHRAAVTVSLLSDCCQCGIAYAAMSTAAKRLVFCLCALSSAHGDRAAGFPCAIRV